MSDLFRNFLKKIGSGEHTSKHLTRQEAQEATELMLKGIATPAQIGAFMIAHRIKRPTPEELAGMMDAYCELGTKLSVIEDKEVIILGTPYDGRSRTVPVTLITALMLSVCGKAILLHGGDTMPTKYGIPLISLLKGLNLDCSSLSLDEVQTIFEKTGFAFVYLPQLFPLAASLVAYRDQIGKRPPLATLELIWSPYEGKAHIVAGFVHPPTETRFQKTFKLLNQSDYTLIKGLEGSCDLALSRPAIIGLGNKGVFSRLTLNPRDYGFSSSDVPLENVSQAVRLIEEVLQGESNELTPSAIWNGGFYLWRFGLCDSIEEGFFKAKTILDKGELISQLTVNS